MSDEFKPLSYNDWLAKNGLSATEDFAGYSKYLVDWYKKQQNPNVNLRADYIQLLRDLNFVFGDEKRDRFLSNINFGNREELINSLPYFVTKIKELVKDFNEKRQSVKKSKLKYNLNSSNKGIETLLYEYVLRCFTSKDRIAPVPYKQLSGLLPELNSSNKSFFIEVEELYDNSNYSDFWPGNPARNVSTKTLSNQFPYQGNLNENQILGMLTASLKERAASTPLSKIFFDFLDTNNPALDESEMDLNGYLNAINTIVANEKYMGNDLYALTAVKNLNAFSSDYTTNLNLEVGNNWFYWPSGAKIYKSDPIDNIYFPININNSDLVKNGATGTGDFRTSDIILTDKKGYIEGSWLLGPRMEFSKHRITVNIDSGEKRQFLWPYVGFNLTKNTNQWRGFSLNDDSNKYFYFLSDKEKNLILEKYYTSRLPVLSSQPVYLNSTNFYKSGALPAQNALDADVIIKQKHTYDFQPNYSSKTEAAYLYRFHETEIPIKAGVTNVLWPLTKIDDENQNIPITVTDDFCDPIELKMVNVQEGFRGAVAGTNADEADIIYKIDKRTGNPIEAAWLANSDVSTLNTSTSNDIKVYNTKASSECCETLLVGSNQDGIFTHIKSGQRISFVWGDKDTYADEVFNYSSHKENCPYEKLKTNYYSDQDYNNPRPIAEKTEPWKDCTCKATLYSPIGHRGNSFDQYDGITDLLYADPQGTGEDFDLNTWRDTRCLGYKSSPQFSFFKLDNNAPDVVGFWNGQWRTPDGGRMVLKTGRRYTYYRTHFKRLGNDGPMMVLDYQYKDPIGFCLNSTPVDMILCVDLSNSQKYNLDVTRDIVQKIVEGQPDNVHIGIVAFDSRQFRCSYLSRYPDLGNFLDQLFAFDDSNFYAYRTNIVDALRLAEFLLTTTITEDNKRSIITWNKICRDVNATVVDAQRKAVFNQPRLNEVDKKIILISDGDETSEVAKGYGKTQAEANRISEGKLALIPYVNSLKAKKYPLFNSPQQTVGFTFQCIDIGPLSMINNTMERIASSTNLYFNLQKYLITNDTTDVTRIIKNIIYNTVNCYDVYSRWKKLIRSNTDGSWVESNEETDMVLRPGDNLVYLHRETINYISPLREYANFSIPSKSFNIKIPLRGWDYAKNRYVNDPVVTYRGGKPFWGKVYVDVDDTNNFQKEFMYMGGHVRWFDEYLPITQPEVSTMILNYGDFIEYIRKTPERLRLSDVFDFVEYKTNYQWNKLEFSKQFSNLERFFKSDRLEYVATPTLVKSDMVIEGFYEFKPARYNYYARKRFTFEQDLQLIYKCRPTYVDILTGKVLEAQYPYANLDNVNFPTTPLIPYTNNFITKKSVGGYMLPTNLGVPYFSPYGYNFEIDEEKIALFERQKREMIFLDPEKYGPINRNLTNIDNLAPTRVASIDNRWMMIPYGSGETAGVITNTKNFQKFTAYQSEYEILGVNNYGVSRPTDNFQFYNQNRQWIGGGTTERGEVTEKMYLDRRAKFLANLGIMTKWRMDLFGNNYALYKSKSDANLIETDNSDINYNDIDASRERLSTDDYPRTQLFPENYENIAYNSKANDYLDFIVEEE
jgi:hypothetical protein